MAILKVRDKDGNIIDIPSIVGPEGAPGATFTPTVSEDGILSWTNDKGLNNPAPVNIMGPQGPAGESAPDLPSGGEDWRKIASVTLTESVVSLKISTDMEGNPFSLQKMYARINAYPEDGATTILGLRFDDQDGSLGYHVEVTNGVRDSACTVMSVELFGGIARAFTNTVQYGGYAAAFMNAENRNKIDRSKMTMLKFFSKTNGGFKSGSKFEVWGC